MLPLCQILGITVNELLSGETISPSDYVEKAEGTMIEMAKEIEVSNLKRRIYQLYDMMVSKVEVSDAGAGSQTYFITTDNGKYVVKYPSENRMNHPELEPDICSYLRDKGIPACDFIRNLPSGS